MNASRTTPLRLACGVVLAATLFACDSRAPVLQPEALAPSAAVAGASLAEKEAALSPGVSLGGIAPASSQYTVTSIPYAPEVGTPANLGPACDDCVMNDVPIGFPFTFYGVTYTTLQISSNGFLRFAAPNNDSGCCSGRPIPLDDLWNNIIAFAWTDLNPSAAGAGQLRFETRGAAPNRRFVLQVDGVTIWPNTDPRVNQWVVLHEGSNIIEIHTGNLTPHTQNVTQGIENAAGTDAAFVDGRVATVFSLSNDGVRFTPQQVNPVPIHRIYSGDPARGGDTISLADPHVYVEILDVLTLMSASTLRSANDVRIGASFATGVPAESFTLPNIGGSPVQPDFRGRWSRQALQDAGLLPLGSTTLIVWGGDPNTGSSYRGERAVTVIPPPAPPGVCWNNADRFAGAVGVGLITHPNGGTGPIAGQHVSMSDPVNNTAGSNVLLQPGGPHFRLADDFVVGADGCTVAQVAVYAYQTGGVPTWTGANLNIRSGSVTGPVVASSSTGGVQFTGVYRTFNGVLNDANRPIHRITFSFPNVHLAPGTYWIDWQVEGGSSAWGPYITLPPVPPGGNNTQTVLENGQQMTVGGVWQPTLAPPGAELPFEVRSPGAPAYAPAGSPVRTRLPLLPSGYSSRTADGAQ